MLKSGTWAEERVGSLSRGGVAVENQVRSHCQNLSKEK
jgi:hypothetical protein